MNTTLKAGTVVGGQFEVLELAGRGGTGDVYLVQHQTSGVQYAMKVLSHERAEADPALVTHYHLEAAVGTLVTSPNIVKTHGCAEDKALKIYYLVMEYIQGETLSQYMAARTDLSIEKKLTIIRECAKGISVLSHAGIIHRDIKPDNIIMDEKEIPKLTDFGIALVPGCTDPGQVREQDGSLVSLVMGTPVYSAPEQCTDSHAATSLSDIYSLGVCLYQMLTGTLPFPESPDPYQTIEHVLKDSFQKPSVLNSDVPSMVDDLVSDMLNRNPEKRPQNADELIHWIDNILWELPKITVIRKKRPVQVEETEEDASDKDIFAPDMTDVKRKKKILFLAILGLVVIVAVMVLDSQVHFTRKLKIVRKKQKTVQIQQAEPAAEIIPEKKKTVILIAEPENTVRKPEPVNWAGLNEQDMLKNLNSTKVGELAFQKRPLEEVLQKLKADTGLTFVSTYPGMKTEITVKTGEVTLSKLINMILYQCPDCGARVEKGHVLLFSRSAAEAERKKKLFDEKLAAFRDEGIPQIEEAEQILTSTEKKLKTLSGRLKTERKSQKQLKTIADEAAKLPALLDKAATLLRKGETLASGLESVPAVAAEKRKIAGFTERITEAMAQADQLKASADTAVSMAKERSERLKRDKELFKERHAEEQKQQEEIAEKLRKEKLKKEEAENAVAESERKRREEELRKANALSREQQIQQAKENLARASADYRSLRQKAEELDRLKKDAEKLRVQLEKDNARYPLGSAKSNLAAEQRALDKWEQEQRKAEEDQNKAVAKINSLVKRGGRSSEFKAAEKEQKKAAAAKRRATQEISRLRMRVTEAKRIAGIAQKVDEARAAEKKIDAEIAANNAALIKADEAVGKAELVYYGQLYQVKERNFIKLSDPVISWNGLNADTVQQKMQETMVVRLRFNGISLRNAAELISKASGLKITVPDEAAGMTVTADFGKMPLSDVLTKICTDKNVTTLPHTRTLNYIAAENGLVTIGF